MKQLLIKRSKRKNNFTIINNEIIKHPVMSFEAKGLLCFILSLPDDWTLYKDWLMKEFSIGRTYLNRCLQEIEEAGYLARVDIIAPPDGRFKGQGFIFYEENTCSKPTDASAQNRPRSDAGFTAADNQHLLSTNTIPNTNIITNIDISDNNNKPASKKFVKPTAEQITEYAASINFNLAGAQFFDYYESKGWMIGKNPMKDWKAAVRTWKRNEHPTNQNKNGNTGGTHRISEDFGGGL